MKTKKRLLSLLLCGAMLFSLCSQSVLAEGSTQDSGQTIGASGLCEHHTEHDGNCGYVPATEGAPCGYVCEICNAEGDGETAAPSDTEKAVTALEQLLYGTATPSNAVMPLADYNGPAIVMGTDHLEGGQASSVYFGRYQQTSVGENAPGEGTEGVDWIYSNTANHKGQGPYYLKDPVKWRVLFNNMSGQLFLLSDQNLDVKRYHDDFEEVTWEKSTVRSWLNGYGSSENNGGDYGKDYANDNFIDAAFSEAEQGAIAETTVNNDGSSDTNDKIFLLSTEEVKNSDYGFTGDASRKTTNTAFVTGGGQNGSDIMGTDDFWWLRTSHPDNAAKAICVSPWGSLDGDGAFVHGDNIVVRPAFNLDPDAVLFTSAAAGGKDDAAVDSDLTAVGTGTGEWKLTLKDDSRTFNVTSNTTVSIEQGKTADISYSDAQIGNNEYVSAMIVDEHDTILYYGRVAQGSESGTASVTIPAGLQPGSYTLKMFNEQYNGDKKTDYASAFEDISLTVTADTTAPALSGVSATRTSETTATVTFTSDEAGTYYYEVVENSEDAPTIDIIGMGTSCARGENTISLDSLTGAGAKDIYIVVKDAAGNVSSPALKMTIPAYVAPSYGISATPSTLDFGSTTEGYEAAPAEQTVTIENTGNQTITLNQPTATDFTIGNLSATELAVGGTATFTVQPNTGLTVGDHSETLSISGSNGVSASVSLSFTVASAAPTTYTLTVNLSGGSGSTTGGEYAEGAVINIDAGSRSNYRFNGWTTSNGGSFANASSASTTFTMPAANTTIYAHWKYSGGGSSGDDGSTTRYTLTFETNGGSAIEKVTGKSGNTIDLSDYTPTREGYDFSGWYSDKGLTNKITEIKLTGNKTVYAGWTKQNPATGVENPFTDVSESDWFYNDVMFVYGNGLMNGTSATIFEPYSNTSRSQIAAIFYRLAGSPAVEGKNTFTDVEYGPGTAWYYDAVTWVQQSGIMGGYGDNLFGPNDSVTREQLAQIFYNYAKYKGYDVSAMGSLDSFTDKDSVSAWAQEAMKWAVGNGVINGRENNLLDPQGTATRAEIAAMLHRFIEKCKLVPAAPATGGSSGNGGGTSGWTPGTNSY